jgi:S1-C subfamily serine protease
MGCSASMRAGALVSGLVVLAMVSSVRAELGGAVELTRLQDQFRALADSLSPSVVSISVAATADDSDDAVRSDSMNGERLEEALSRTTRTVGTGFVFDPDGYVLTNEHVIAGAAQIWVTSDSGTVWPAVVIGSDPRADIAVLKVPIGGLTPVKFAASGSVKRGDWTIALGNPIGLAASGRMSMSVGIVSATDRSLPKLNSQEQRLYTDLIQTTAEINLGNSGGPLFNLNGEVIGISTAVILPQKGTNGIGFAVPANDELMAKVRDLKEGREVVYGYLGARVSTPTLRQRRAAGGPDAIGVMIEEVETGSPGDGLLKPSDMVLGINDRPVNQSEQFVRLVGSSSITEPTKFTIRRDGDPLEVMVQLRQRQLPSVAVNRASQRIRWRGMLLGPIPANWKATDPARPTRGLLVIGIDQDPQERGIRVGTVITSVAGKAVSSVIELQSILNDTPAELCRIETAPQSTPVVAGAE